MKRTSSLSYLVPLGAVLAISAVVACGDTDADDLFGGAPGDDDGDTNGSTGGGATTGGAGGVGGNPTAGGMGGVPTTTSSMTTSTMTTSTMSTTQSSSSNSSSSSATTVTTGPGGGPEVYCANAPCSAGEVCCFHLQNAALDACSPAGSCGDGYIELSCNDASDCGFGEVCCGLRGGTNNIYYSELSCQVVCLGDDITMCFQDDGACGFGQNCQPSQVLGQGYEFCGN